MSGFVPDASVTIKWFLNEKENKEAIEIFENNPKFVAPEFLKVEFDAVLAKWNRSGRLEYDESLRILELFNKIQIYFTSYNLIKELAFEYASRLPITYYDALYIVTAKLYDSVMITYDKKLLDSVNNSELSDYVRLLS